MEDGLGLRVCGTPALCICRFCTSSQRCDAKISSYNPLFRCSYEADPLLQYLTLRSLRIPKVHHLVQQLVYDDEIVPYRFLLKLFEILGKNLDDFVQKEEDLRGVGIAFRKGEQVEIIMSDVEILSKPWRNNK